VDFDRVMIRDGGLLTVASAMLDDRFAVGSAAEREVTGQAGDLTLIADTLQMENGGRIQAQSIRSDGGNIDIRVTEGVELSRSSISAEVRGGPGTEGGNISIDPIWVILDDGSLISTRATEGRGGDISIRTQGLFVSPDSSISAASQFGVSGTVAVDSPESNLSGELATMSRDYLDATALLAGRCTGRSGAGRFAVDEGYAIPAAPDSSLPSSLRELSLDALARVK
jgi:large exoprotein involved in heme utilization and adhesion